MIAGVERRGDGIVVTTSGRVTFDDAKDVLEALVADSTLEWFVIDFSAADSVFDDLDEIHDLARTMRRFERLHLKKQAFVTSTESSSAHVADYRFMMTQMMEWWNGEPAEIQSFADVEMAVAWARSIER